MKRDRMIHGWTSITRWRLRIMRQRNPCLGLRQVGKAQQLGSLFEKGWRGKTD